MNSNSSMFAELRKSVDGSDNFMTGHRIIKSKGRTRNASRIAPEWARSDVEVRKVLLRSFPKLETDSKQRGRAARWASVIHLYFRMQESYLEIAQELEITPTAVKFLIRSIKRVAAGKSANGSGLHGRRRGAPLKGRRNERI
jgi:hypothetical protein